MAAALGVAALKGRDHLGLNQPDLLLIGGSSRLRLGQYRRRGNGVLGVTRRSLDLGAAASCEREPDDCPDW